MNTIIVTGGAGFIGANFVRHALAFTDARILVIDKLTYAGNLCTIEDLLGGTRVAFLQADIADRQSMAAAFDEYRPSALVNLAAETHVDRSIDDPRPFVDTNIVGTFVLLETARKYLASADDATRETFRFLHVSTDEVYGTLDETGKFAETTP
ncbi:MAG TPA: GDP-mannose 4,6-dehydratase, partial [Blastocatellia bacterium]